MAVAADAAPEGLRVFLYAAAGSLFPSTRLNPMPRPGREGLFSPLTTFSLESADGSPYTTTPWIWRRMRAGMVLTARRIAHAPEE